MSGILDTLPATATDERESLIFEAVAAGRATFDWEPISISRHGYRLKIWALRDAIQIEGVRVNVRATTLQKIADVLGAVLPTPLLCDDVWRAATKLRPQTISPHTTSTAAMIRHSRMVDQEIGGRSGLVADVGKSWALTKRGSHGFANYGWHLRAHEIQGHKWRGIPVELSMSSPDLWLIQDIGTTHGRKFTDYSQVACNLIRIDCELDGKPLDIREVYQSETLATVVSHEGKIHTRVPEVEEIKGKVVLPPITVHADHEEESDTMPAPPPSEDGTTRSHGLVLPDEPNPNLRRGSSGDEVKAWQKKLRAAGYPVEPDGRFGPITERYTLQATARREVPPGSDVIFTANHLDTTSPGIAFIKARNYTPGPRSEVRWVVIHTAETGEVLNAAENLAQWAAGATAPKASWHYAVDADSITQSVRETDIAWHAKQGNRYGIGIEHAGRARQTEADWNDEYSRAMLKRSAELVAQICKRWAIPIRKIGPAEILSEERGICGHVDFTVAYKVSGGHYDPGSHFPWDHYIELVKAESDRLG